MNTVADREGRKDLGSRPQVAQKFVTPEVNIFETKDGYVLEAEMPGVNKQGLELTLEGNELTILGHRERAESTAQALYRESPQAGYRRVFELDPAIDKARIDAKIDQGILTVHLPKSEQVKPRKIQVGV
jgi:HSP20 family protein